MKQLLFLTICVITLVFSNNTNGKDLMLDKDLIYSDTLTYCAGPASKCECYRLIYNANLVPVVGTPSTDPIDNCFWSSGYTNAAIIGGVQYTLGLFPTYQALLDFLSVNNLYLDENSNYYMFLDTSH
jgi:hypothetical protein